MDPVEGLTQQECEIYYALKEVIGDRLAREFLVHGAKAAVKRLREQGYVITDMTDRYEKERF